MRRSVVPVIVALLVMLMLTAGVAVAVMAHVTKGSLPAKTSGDVASLIVRENAVVAALREFSGLRKVDPVGGWETQLAYAEEQAASAEANLKSDLARAPTTTTTPPTTTAPHGCPPGFTYNSQGKCVVIPIVGGKPA